jgi:uncharacterized protein YlxW (UPF0749 family)
MIAVQFQTIKQPVVRDTRDMWELREDLTRAQELHSNLLNEIYKYEQRLTEYESVRNDSKEDILRDTLEELKADAGLTEVKGQGIIVTVDRAYNVIGAPTENISAYLLRRFINELNSYEAKEISIAGHRVINSTVIREIQGETKIDSYPINSVPFEIKIIADDPEKLYNRINASKAIDEFYVENFILRVSEPINEVIIPAYSDPIRVKHMEPLKSESGVN